MQNIAKKYFYLPFLAGVFAYTFSQSASAGPIEYAGNGHFYEFILLGTAGPTFSWDSAKTAAEAVGGYLTTVTSAGEQSFLESLPQPSGAYWAGGRDLLTEGTWLWETGPETGTQFWSGGPGGSTTTYANWFSGEPNNSGGEDYLSWNISSGGAGWNDVGLINSAMKGYIVEYNSNPNPNSVPEPSVLALLALAFAGIVLSRRRKLL